MTIENDQLHEFARNLAAQLDSGYRITSEPDVLSSTVNIANDTPIGLYITEARQRDKVHIVVTLSGLGEWESSAPRQEMNATINRPVEAIAKSVQQMLWKAEPFYQTALRKKKEYEKKVALVHRESNLLVTASKGILRQGYHQDLKRPKRELHCDFPGLSFNIEVEIDYNDPTNTSTASSFKLGRIPIELAFQITGLISGYYKKNAKDESGKDDTHGRSESQNA